MSSRRFSRTEMEQIVIMVRFHLYNRGFLYGPYAIQNLMERETIFPLPSISAIKRILSRNCLTHRRTGYYPEDHDPNSMNHAATCERGSETRRSFHCKPA
jgi:hypothetical protein